MKNEGRKRERPELLRKNGRQSFIYLRLLSVFIRVNPWLQSTSLSLSASAAIPYAPRRERIASAASFARSPRSPTGPTHDGQPFSQGHAAISSRVFARSKLCARQSGTE